MRGPDGVDRSAIVSGRFRFEALANSDYPAVGDWVVLAAGDGDPAVITAVQPRRSAFVRSAADASRRTAGHLADEQVLAANVDVAFLVAGLDHDFNLRRLERYLAVAWSSGVRPIVVLNKADVALDLEQRLLDVESVAPAVPIVVLSALTGDHLADLTPVSRGRPDRGRAGLVGRRQVDARQRAAWRGAPGHRRGPVGRFARAAHDDPSRAVRAARRGDAHRHARDPRARGGRCRRGCRGRLRRHRRAGAALSLLRLPARRRARVRHPVGARRRQPVGGSIRQPSQARARARARRAQGRLSGSRGRIRSAGSRSTRPSNARCRRSTGRPADRCHQRWHHDRTRWRIRSCVPT